MLQTILAYLPVLGAVIAVNIVLGIYNNIENIKECFDWRKLVKGVIKAACVSLAFVGLAYVFDATGTVIDTGVFEINPDVIMISAIVLYTGKAIQNLISILGITVPNKNKELK